MVAVEYLLVAAGPIRLLSVAGACALAVLLRRRLTDPEMLVWACSAVLFLRCATESVMVAYYLWPLTVFAAVLVVKRQKMTRPDGFFGRHLPGRPIRLEAR